MNMKVLRDRGAIFISSIFYGSGSRFYGYTKGKIAEIVAGPLAMIGCMINSYAIVIKDFDGELSVFMHKFVIAFTVGSHLNRLYFYTKIQKD